MSARACIALAAAAMLAAGCTDYGSTAPPRAPAPSRFDTEIQPIFSANCAISGCHAPPVSESLDLRAGLAYDQIVSVASVQRPAFARIRPGAPDSSYLLVKVSDCACFPGMRMPAGALPLTDADIARLLAWTQDGAPR